MDFEDFRDRLVEDLGAGFYERTGHDCDVETTVVNKLQNAGYEGIVKRPETCVDFYVEVGWGNWYN